MQVGAVKSSFKYDDFFDEKPNVGYETLLYDCMLGDETLFQRADSIETSWAAVDGVLHPEGGGCRYMATPRAARDQRKPTIC